MDTTQIIALADSSNQPAISTATGHNEAPPKVLKAEFPIEFLFPLLIVFIVAFLGVEKRYPRDTEDYHQPDLDRQDRREASRARRKAVKWQK